MEYEIWNMKYITLAHFRHFSHFRHSTIITYFQIHSILTNKPNFRNEKMNISIDMKSIYMILYRFAGWKNKANSNPIQTQFKANKAKNKPNLTQFKANSNPIFTQFRRKSWLAGKRRGRLRRAFTMRSKPHPSTIAGLIMPASGAWIVASFNVPTCIGTRLGFMPDRHMPDGHTSRRRSYDYFVVRAAAAVLPDKSTAGKRDCHYGNYDGNY